ncbi:uncharacterized protein LOC108669333 isoform X2 [Hyalella azteca]|uniref:Uncharacterized protein LOC108669333 isoform X2 n=1 Tax=Hyalella azteca TaxID=294128 RepID=A0A8B7NES2_HYAAZ|nr:uncharacterized protein LOC108669333 isoform X2 [Hyalella azteca]
MDDPSVAVSNATQLRRNPSDSTNDQNVPKPSNGRSTDPKSDIVLLPIHSPKTVPSGWGRLSWFEPLAYRDATPKNCHVSACSVSASPTSGYVTEQAFLNFISNPAPVPEVVTKRSLEDLHSIPKSSLDDIRSLPFTRTSLQSLHRSVLSLRTRQASRELFGPVVRTSSDEGKPPSGPKRHIRPELQKSTSNVDLRSFARFRTRRAELIRSLKDTQNSPPIPPRNSCNFAFVPERPDPKLKSPVACASVSSPETRDASGHEIPSPKATAGSPNPEPQPQQPPQKKWSFKRKVDVPVRNETRRCNDQNNDTESVVLRNPSGANKSSRFSLFRRSVTQAEFGKVNVNLPQQASRLVSSSSSCSSGSASSLNQPNGSPRSTCNDNNFQVNAIFKLSKSKSRPEESVSSHFIHCHNEAVDDRVEDNNCKRSSPSSSQARDDSYSLPDQARKNKALAFLSVKDFTIKSKLKKTLKNNFIIKRNRSQSVNDSQIDGRSQVVNGANKSDENSRSKCDSISSASETGSLTIEEQSSTDCSKFDSKCHNFVSLATKGKSLPDESSTVVHLPRSAYFKADEVLEFYKVHNSPLDAFSPPSATTTAFGYFPAAEVDNLSDSVSFSDEPDIFETTSSLEPSTSLTSKKGVSSSQYLQENFPQHCLPKTTDVFRVPSISFPTYQCDLSELQSAESKVDLTKSVCTTSVFYEDCLDSLSSSKSSAKLPASKDFHITPQACIKTNAIHLANPAIHESFTILKQFNPTTAEKKSSQKHSSLTVTEESIQTSQVVNGRATNAHSEETSNPDESISGLQLPENEYIRKKAADDNDVLSDVRCANPAVDHITARKSEADKWSPPQISGKPTVSVDLSVHANCAEAVLDKDVDFPARCVSAAAETGCSNPRESISSSDADTKRGCRSAEDLDSVCACDSSASGDDMSHPGGTLRRGIKATTSRIIGASIRRPGLSPAISLDRSLGYGPTEPSRFVDGVSFKGKLIGVLEVEAARGDRMCQEALAELKGAVRAAGEHKQRIAVTVAMDGIRLRDDRTGDCLYHHPVHKISFIAQDMTDSRAFGYIFGSPDAGHKFFGIKTEKTASQVVIAMRDLFQVVFEMKKKEIEKARSQLEEGRDGVDFKDDKAFDPFGDSFRPTSLPGSANSSGGKGGVICGSSTLPSSKTRIPSTSSCGSNVSISNIPPTLAPPPLTGRSRHDSSHSRKHARQHGMGGSDSEHLEFGANAFPVDFSNVTRAGAQSVPPHDVSEDRYAVFKEVRPSSDESLNEFGKSNTGGNFTNCRMAMSHEAVDSRTGGFEDGWSLNDLAGTNAAGDFERRQGSNYDVFVDLDPLGTGKSKPFIDKKDFFNDVRKQKKRLLRELGDGEDSHPGSPRTQTGVIPTEVSVLVASLYTSSGHPCTSSEVLTSHYPSLTTSTTPMHIAAIASHSFSESFSPPLDSNEDYRDRQHHTVDLQQQQQFETPVSGFADFNRFSGESPRSQRSEMSSSSMPEDNTPQLLTGALTVALPPESFRDSPPSRSPPHTSHEQRQSSASPERSPQQAPKHLFKQTLPCPTDDSVSPKTLPRSHKFLQQESVDGDWDSPRQKSVRDEGHHEHDGFNVSRGLSGWDEQSSESSQHYQSREAIASVGGMSPRPRPRGSLTKHLSASSATLPLRQPYRYGRKLSHDQNFDLAYEQHEYRASQESFGRKYGSDELFSSPEGECRPFPNEDADGPYEEAPYPPPRPAPIEPPPLPPKRQPTDIKLRPPPRPPSSASQDAHYLYINDKYDLPPESSRANTSTGEVTTSPPIPLPSRKPRYSEAAPPACLPNRANKPTFIASEPFHFPRPNLSPTHDSFNTGAIPKMSSCSRDSTPSKTSTPSGKSPRSGKRPSTGSIDLTNTSLDQLATKLEIPVEQLAKMTVVELAACLAQLQLKQESAETTYSEDFKRGTSRFSGTSNSSSCERSQDRIDTKKDHMNKFSDDEDFARFDAQFPASPLRTPDFPLNLDSAKNQKLGAPVSEDRYAVFRELTVTAKHKSVFDENFLTPQNSMEDEISEVSSGTFKVNFAPANYRQDSMDMKSSVSDDFDHDREYTGKHWSSTGGPEEGVTIFRSPDISEYENFEPTFEAKFADDFSEVDRHSLDLIEMTGPLRSPATQKLSTDSGKSPFTDDFSCISQEEIVKTLNAPKLRKENTSKFEDDFVPPVEQDKYAVFRELEKMKNHSKRKSSTSSKSPFDDNFVENGPRECTVMDSGFLSTAEVEFDKFDDVFKDAEETKNEMDRTEQSTKFNANAETDSVDMVQEDNDSLNKSPIDDYPPNRNDRYEVLKEVESEREPSLDGDVGENGQRLSRSSPYGGSWHDSSRNTPYDEQKFRYESPQSKNEGASPCGEVAFIDSEHTAAMARGHQEGSFRDNKRERPTINQTMSLDDRMKNCSRESPYEDCLSGSHDVSLEMKNGFLGSGRPKTAELHRSRSSTTPIGYDRQFSPVPESNSLPPVGSGKGSSGFSRTSSVCNDAKPSPSPFDDNFISAVESVADEVCFEAAFPSLQPLPDSLVDDGSEFPFTDDTQDDVFVTGNNAFADFENAFQEDRPSVRENENLTASPNSHNPSFEEAQEIFPDGEVEFRVSARFAQTSKDDPDDIFRRNSDPFAEDFFAEDCSPSVDVAISGTECSKSWKEPFEVFNSNNTSSSSTK